MDNFIDGYITGIVVLVVPLLAGIVVFISSMLVYAFEDITLLNAAENSLIPSLYTFGGIFVLMFLLACVHNIKDHNYKHGEHKNV